MEKNQFRRDPVTGRWAIILSNDLDIEDLVGADQKTRRKRKQNVSKYCAGFEAETPPEIFAIRDEGTQRNEPGWKVRVLPYTQPFIQIHGDLNNRGIGLYDVIDGIGAHELVIESPHPGEDIHDMSPEQVQNVLLAYRARILDLKRDTRFRYVMVHKNYGEREGELKDHAHSHIIATPITPARVKVELLNAMEHYKYKERCLFCDIIFQELSDDERVITQNEQFVAVSPFASRAPFSVWILPKKHETFFEWNSEYRHLAKILQQVLVKIKHILSDPPFVMALHTGPNMIKGQHRGYWKSLEKDYHWYFEITPRFRTYTSFEIGSGFQVNAVSPERATKILKNTNID
ncbi:MAG: DUF4931 domain-containing protein [bacterium]